MWAYVIKDGNVKEIVGMFHERNYKRKLKKSEELKK